MTVYVFADLDVDLTKTHHASRWIRVQSWSRAICCL